MNSDPSGFGDIGLPAKSNTRLLAARCDVEPRLFFEGNVQSGLKLSQYAYEGSIAYTKGYISLFRRTRSSLIRVHHCPWIWKEARVLSEQIDFHENPPAAQVDFHENPCMQIFRGQRPRWWSGFS